MSLSDPRLCSWRSARSKQRIHCRPCPDLVSWNVCTCACICSQAHGLAEPSSLRPVHVTTLFPLYNWAKEKVGAPCSGSRTEPGTWEALGVPAACPMAQPHELPFPWGGMGGGRCVALPVAVLAPRSDVVAPLPWAHVVAVSSAGLAGAARCLQCLALRSSRRKAKPFWAASCKLLCLGSLPDGLLREG